MQLLEFVHSWLNNVARALRKDPALVVSKLLVDLVEAIN